MQGKAQDSSLYRTQVIHFRKCLISLRFPRWRSRYTRHLEIAWDFLEQSSGAGMSYGSAPQSSPSGLPQNPQLEAWLDENSHPLTWSPTLQRKLSIWFLKLPTWKYRNNTSRDLARGFLRLISEEEGTEAPYICAQRSLLFFFRGPTLTPRRNWDSFLSWPALSPFKASQDSHWAQPSAVLS